MTQRLLTAILTVSVRPARQRHGWKEKPGESIMQKSPTSHGAQDTHAHDDGTANVGGAHNHLTGAHSQPQSNAVAATSTALAVDRALPSASPSTEPVGTFVGESADAFADDTPELAPQRALALLPASGEEAPPPLRAPVLVRPPVDALPSNPVQDTVDDLAGQLAPSSQRIYRLDITRFLTWLADQDLALAQVDRRAIIAYRAELAAHYQKATAARHLTVVRRFLAEATLHGVLAENPAAQVRGFRKVGADETPHQALDRDQVRHLFAAVEARAHPPTPAPSRRRMHATARATPERTSGPPRRRAQTASAASLPQEEPGAQEASHAVTTGATPLPTSAEPGIFRWTVQLRRDLALLALLARTGLRRAEASHLDREDLVDRQGHSILFVRHGKGDQRRVVKVPVDVRRLLDVYLAAAGQIETLYADGRLEHPLFVACKRNGCPRVVGLADQRARPCEGHVRLTGGAIEDLVKRYGACLDTHLTPHDLRATFITLALEGGAKLEQVQYAVGHADPRTTEHYQRRKLNLDDNAVDYIRL